MFCDRVLVMRDGRVAADVPREELTEARLVREELGAGRRARRPPRGDPP